ncbi:hypothetical protein SLS53_007625 [Cytospora paraplurivora]|uniref:TPR-like protein n=1 Tax=Cytospora paraplurivora TaxID=2898453 RepID=A0AAN9U8P9_9PEZI
MILGAAGLELPRPAEVVDLEDAIVEAQKTLQDTDAGYSNRPHYLTNLLLALQLRYKRTYETQDPGNGAAKVSPNYLRHESLLNDQDLAFQSSRRQGLPEYPALFFKQLIQNAQRDVDAISLDSDEAENLLLLQYSLHNLVVAYRRRYERMRQVDEDIEYAAEAAQQAVDFLSPHEQLRAGCLHDLASTLLIQYERTQAGEDLRRAVEAAQQAVDATPNKDAFRAACLNTLGLALMKRYTRNASIEDLDDAVRLLREAISLSLLGSLIAGDSMTLWNGPSPLGSIVGASEQREPEGTDVAPGVNNLMRVHAQRNNMVYLNQTGGGAILRHIVTIRKRTVEQQRYSDQVKQNLGAARQALESPPKSLPDCVEWPCELGRTLLRLYEITSRAEDIDTAVEVLQKVVELAPTDFPGWADRLVQLGWAYLFRNKTDDVVNAIRAFQKAVDSASSIENNLLGLGTALATVDPKKAIEVGEKAIYLTPPNYSGWASRLVYLSYIYNCQYSKSHETQALDNAIDAAQQAFLSAHPGSLLDAYTILFLGRLLMERSKRKEEIKDISDAIEAYQEAVNMTSQGHGGPIAIYELVSALRTKSDRTGKRGDVEDLEATLKQAADLHWKYSDEQPWNGRMSFLSSSFAKH